MGLLWALKAWEPQGRFLDRTILSFLNLFRGEELESEENALAWLKSSEYSVMVLL